MANDWNEVRYDLDKPGNFTAICNSPWYTDTVYDKFSDAEYERRHNHARKIMERDGLDALILTGSPNIYSMGRFVTWATGMQDDRAMCQYVVLPRDGEPTLVYAHAGCHIEAVRQMVGIKDVRGSEGDQYGKVIADRIEELGLQAGRIGITAADRKGVEYMGLMCFRELEKRLPDATFEFLPDLLHELVVNKSEEEIEAVTKAGELVVAAIKAIIAAARPGAYEYQLAAAGTYAIMNGGGKVGLMMVGSTSMEDPRLVFANPFPSHRVLKEGDIIVNEIIATYKGYGAKFGHPISVGPPTATFDAFYKDVVLGGFRALYDRLQPGNTLADIQQAGSYFRDKGAQSRPGMVDGMDFGTALPRVRVNRISAAEGDEVVQPGRVYAIAITPIDAQGIYGMVLARSYITTEDGKRDLTPFPLDGIAVAS